MTLDQLLEDVLGVVGRLVHGDVRVAASQVDAGTSVASQLPGDRGV